MSTEEKIFNALESLNKFDYSLIEKLALGTYIRLGTVAMALLVQQ